MSAGLAFVDCDGQLLHTNSLLESLLEKGSGRKLEETLSEVVEDLCETLDLGEAEPAAGVGTIVTRSVEAGPDSNK